jgi:hypothetical protein
MGPLLSNDYYAIKVTYLHSGEIWTDNVPWTKETSWNLSDHKYLWDQNLADDGRFFWSVRVMYQTSTDANGNPTGTPRSPESKVRTLIWQPPFARPTSTPIP